MIYLDYAADTPADEDVLKTFLDTQRAFFANPNSVHPLGAAAARKLAECYEGIKAFFTGAEDYELIQTASASEANNLAVKGVAGVYAANGGGGHIVSARIEHPSVGGALVRLQSGGFEVEFVDVGTDGKVDLDHLKSLIGKNTVLVSVCCVDGELGAVQPIGKIAEIVAEYPNCRFHTDAVQAVGKISGSAFLSGADGYLNGDGNSSDYAGGFSDDRGNYSDGADGLSNGACGYTDKFPLNGIDCLSFAAHKIYGLNGTAFLLRHKKTLLAPLVHGGGFSPYRGGTPSLPLAASALTAMTKAYGNLGARYRKAVSLNGFLRGELSGIKEVEINSPLDALPYILNLSVTGIKAERMRDALSGRGICVSVKSACSVPDSPSSTVYAVTGDKKRALTSFRVSLSHLTEREELEEFARVLREITAEFGSR
ncbi:MAG: aminotransferase class V-fold PLP-dependent enzyme [Clostridiales bacterium]|jgi:cysteine desulfurase|nr:aminotransferase class V-fold PLP-dependent enzyme [Clostridiales bacterium]